MTVQQFWLKFIHYLHDLTLMMTMKLNIGQTTLWKLVKDSELYRASVWHVKKIIFKHRIRLRPPNLKLAYNKIKFYLLICPLSNKREEFIKLDHITSKTGFNWLLPIGINKLLPYRNIQALIRPQMNIVNCRVHKIMTSGTHSLCVKNVDVWVERVTFL